MNKKSILILLLLLTSIVARSQQITIATYNLRNDNKADSIAGNGWKVRYPVMAGLIRFNDFDIFGTQEGLYHQLINLQDSLPGYNFIGKGRDDGMNKGEFSAIFYKKDKFDLLDNGTFWLSDITNKPNKGWDAALPRVCTWGYFRDKKSKFKFYLFNLHMDHKGVIALRI
jgi:endonuclease/exonuclease/phosphatase family metal-dependent hydrolase